MEKICSKEDFSLLLKVGDIYWDPQMQYTVVTGTIMCGNISKDDFVDLFNDQGRTRLKCKGVEMNGEILNFGQTGDSVGLLFDYINPNNIRVGHYIGIIKECTTSSSIKFDEKGGVFHVQCVINGIEMDAVFDTGAADISMSLTEVNFMLKHGKLTEADFVGTANYMTADGNVKEGAVINLKTVIIGGKTLHNVKASAISIDAPLLLGQSALSRFCKIMIDYKDRRITFE